MILNEGGNVFKTDDGEPTTQRIQQADVDTTLKWIESITGMDHVNMKLGSTGIKSSSGDLDVAVDKVLEAINKNYKVVPHLKQTIELIKETGYEVDKVFLNGVELN